MPYDEQGNFYGSNEDLGDLKAKYIKPDPVSQIPGQVVSPKQEESKTLREQAVSALMKYNPLMMQKSLQDVPRTLVGGALLPVVAPVSAGVQYLNALPGNLLRRSRGEEEVKTPTAEDLMRKYGEAIAPKTELGRDFQEGLVKTMDTLKIPAAWPMVPNAPKRPMLTPTDVRVGAGQIKQLAKELKETPQDFQAAQSGLKRQNLYGEDTLGVKAQAAADSLGDTLERRRASDRSLIPGVPGVLTPETSMYAVRPKGSRLVQPKVPASAKNFTPSFSEIPDFVDDVYGNVEAGEIPPTMIMSEYGPRFMNTEATRDFKEGVLALDRKKAMEMFPDAPSEPLALRAYEILYSDRNARAAKSLETIEEFLAMPENQRFIEEGIPTPSQFVERFKEAERVVKGPLVNYLSKNVGAEGDPTVKLARQGITYESPERINELAGFVTPTPGGRLAETRVKAGFPAMGSFHEERLAKTGELDKLNEEIAALEEVRTPLFNRAHEEGIDPASIPEYAETTNPLRQKLRQREQLQGELENIKLATAVENISDYAVTPKSKLQMEMDIPYQERQFFPSVTKGGENETFYTVGNRSLLNDIGYQKLGKDLVEDILTGKAGDTSKLTIEGYIRDKGLSRIEAEKAAKVQQQQYRQNLEGVLLKRLQEDPNVKTFGNASIITLNKDTPKDVALRDVSTDTAILDHCVGQGGSAPEGRRNLLTNNQQYYEPIVDPITGERNKNAKSDAYSSYVDQLASGNELISVRDSRTGLPAATIQLLTTGDPGNFRVGYASGAKNGAIEPQYVDAIKQYLNSRADSITSAGENLSDNAGIFDLANSRGRDQAIRAANIPGSGRGKKADELQRTLEFAIQNSPDIRRFVTSDDVKKIFESTSNEVAVVNQPSAARPTGVMRLQDYEGFVDEFNSALEAAVESAMENSNLENPNRVEGAMGRAVANIFDNHLNDPVEFIQEPVARLRRVERDLQNVIQNSYAQRRDVDTELANGLEDFLIDVRGLRASIERRLQAEQDRPAEDRFSLSLQYNIPPVTVLELQARFRAPNITVANLNTMRDYAQAGEPHTIFATLPEESRAGAVRMISDEIERRQQGAAQNQVAAPTIEGFTTEVRRLDEGVGDRVAGVLYAINEAININTRPAEYARAVLQAADQQGTTGTVQDVSVASFLNQFASQLETATRQAFNAPARNEVAVQGEPMPAMGADELLLEHGDRMTQAQRNWLQNFIQRWDTFVDDTPGGAVYRDELERTFDEWSNRERLQPRAEENLGDWEVDEAHGANNRAFVAADLANELFNMDVNTGGVADIPAIENTIFALRNGTVDHRDFRNLPEDRRPAAMNLVADFMQAMIEQPELLDRPVSARDRELLTMFNSLVDDAIEEGSFPAGMANSDLAQLVIDDEIGGLDDLSAADRNRLVELLTRPEQEAPQASARQTLPAPQAPRIQVQDPVPREMQTLNRQDLILRLGPQGVDEAQRIARIYFNDNLFNENVPVSAATNAIRSYNFGPHEGQQPMVRELAARELEELFSTAQQDASILANSLDEAMYQDMDGPEEAMRAADRDISLLRRHGETAWEDVFGPLAEDYPWSRNTQEQAILFLREIADGYRRQRDADRPFAKGGPVKKPMMPPVITRRHPELAEMQYRYGGIV